MLLIEKSRGFSLIEIMVVLVIMGMLAAVVVPNVMDILFRGHVQKIRSDLSALDKALKIYKLDNFVFPSSEQGLEALVEKPEVDPVPRNWYKPYIDRLPKDPWGNPYIYMSPGEYNKSYDIYSLGSDAVRGGDDDAADFSIWDEQ